MDGSVAEARRYALRATRRRLMATALGGDSSPRVSVVIPVYNGERFLAAAVESALQQTYGHMEVVVVDDGSSDATPEVLASFGSRLRAIRQENRGVAAARNRGMAAATGELVAFLDADDVWLPEKVERQVAAWRSAPGSGLVLCGYTVVDEHLRPRYEVPIRNGRRRIMRTLTLDAWGVGLPFTGMVPVALLDRVGGYREDLSTSADLEFSLRLEKAAPVLAINERLALYRTHAGQIHLDVNVFEHDMTMLYRALSEADEWPYRTQRRAEASLHLRLAVARCREGRWREAASHIVVTLRNAPSRIIVAPLAALGRRLVYGTLARR